VNKNVGAFILVGDGLYNHGINPANLSSSIKFPMHSLGVGDTSSKSDAYISKAKTNKIAFLKNKFPVEIEMKFLKLKGKIAYVTIEHNKSEVFSSSVNITSDDQFKVELVNLVANESGFQHYKIKIRAIGEEQNISNNEFEFVIQILENKQKILMLSDGPHPDLGAIRNSLSEIESYDIKLVTGILTPDSLEKFNLIILNQIPSSKNSASTLLNRLKSTRIPVLILVGPNTLIDQFNAIDLGLNISPSSNTEEVQTAFDPNFSLFVLSDETKNDIQNSPPLLAPFGSTRLLANMQNLSLQTIKNIPTDKTMMAFGSIQGRKVGYIVGEGLWRWRLYNYQVNGNHDSFNELIQKMIQYLAMKENEDNFNVYYNSLYQETDAIEFRADLYNDSYELVNSPEVKMTLTNDSLQEFNYQFDRFEDYYRLNTGSMKPGDYKFMAETDLGNQHFTESGIFSVGRNNLENQNVKADFRLLNQISAQSGGKFYPFEQYGTLLDTIIYNKQISSQQYQQTVQTELINLK